MKYSNNTFYLKNSIGTYYFLNLCAYFVLLFISIFLNIKLSIADNLFFITSTLLIFFYINTIEFKIKDLKELNNKQYDNDDFNLIANRLFYNIEFLQLEKLKYEAIYIARIKNFINKNSLKNDCVIAFIIYFYWTSTFSYRNHFSIFIILTILYIQFTYIIFNYLYKSIKEHTFKNLDQGKFILLIFSFLFITYHQSIATRYHFGVEKVNHPFEKFNYDAVYEVEFRLKNDKNKHKGIAYINVNDTRGHDYIYHEYDYGEDYHISFMGEEKFCLTYKKNKLTNIKKLVADGKTWEFEPYYDDNGDEPNYLVYDKEVWCKSINGDVLSIKLTDKKVKEL